MKLLIQKLAKARKQKFLFSTNGKPKSLTQLKQDFLQLLQLLPSSQRTTEKNNRVDYTANPSLLVGQRIRHKFIEDGVDMGYIIAYGNQLNTHEVVYTEDSQHHSYNLIEDLKVCPESKPYPDNFNNIIVYAYLPS